MSSPQLVSVCIPCRNEVQHIAAAVRSAFASSHSELEVLVVDGMSDDGTREVLENLCSEFPRLRVIDNKRQLTPFAFNLGVSHAAGDYVLIMGSRNTLDKNYVSTLLEALHSEEGVACAGGRLEHTWDSPHGRWISAAMTSPFGVGGSNFRTKTERCFVDTVSVPIYAKSIFSKLGMFDETLTRNQDDEFNFRLTESGLKILLVPEVTSRYVVRSSLMKAFRQYFQYGYFKVFVNLKHRSVTTLRQLAPPLFVLFLGSAALIPVVPIYGLPHGMVMGLYLVMAWSATRTPEGEPRRGWRDRAQIVKSIVALHLGYGLGYWRGVWDFAICRRTPAQEMQQQTT